MTVNFNNVRKQAIYAYDRLTQKLNDAIIKNDEQYAEPNDFDRSVNLKGFVLIDAEDIQKDMESLRQMIGTIAMSYEEGDEEFKDVYSEIFPEEKKEVMKCFNEEEDEK
jgi:hypothetical protein